MISEQLRKDNLAIGTDSKGGYLTIDKLASMQELVYEHGLARKIVNTMMIGKLKQLLVPVADSDNIAAYWTAEAGTITGSQPSFSQVALAPEKLRIKIPVSQELLDDSEEDVSAYLANAMAEKIAEKEDYEVFRGDGTNVTGFITTSGVQSGDIDGAYLDFDDISYAIAKLQEAGGKKKNLRLVVSPTTYHYLRVLKDSNDNYLINSITAGNPILKTGAIGDIMGVPVYITDVFTSTAEGTGNGTVTCTDAIMFDKDAALMVIRKDIQQDSDKDYDTDVVNLYVTERMDFRVIHPTLVYHFDQVKDA